MLKVANPCTTNTKMKTRAFLVFTATMTTVTWTPGVDAAVRSQGNRARYWDGNTWQHSEDEAVHQGVGSLQLHLSPLTSPLDGLLDDHSGGSGNPAPPEQDERQYEALRAAGIAGRSNSTPPGAHLPQHHQQSPVMESGGPTPASSSTFFYNSTPAAIGDPGYDQPTAAGHANSGFLAPRGGSSSTAQPLHPPPQLEAPMQQRHTLPPAQNGEQQLQQVLGGFNGMRVAPTFGVGRRDRDPILSIFEDDDDIAATSDSPSRTTSARATCGGTATNVRFRAPPSTESSRAAYEALQDWNSEDAWFLDLSDGSQDGRRVRDQNQPGAGRVVAPLSTGSVDSTQAVIDFPVWRDNRNLGHLREHAGPRGQHGGNDAEYQPHDTSLPPGFEDFMDHANLRNSGRT